MRIDRCRKTRNGMVAFSPSLHCRKPNAIVSRPKPMNIPIICEDPHGFVVPPHCSARSKQHTAPNNSKAPAKSICCIFSLRGKLRSEVLSFLSFKKKRIRNRTTTPIGAFLVKSASFQTIATEASVHPEAPSPACSICKCPTQNGTKADSKTKGAHYNSHVQRSFVQ